MGGRSALGAIFQCKALKLFAHKKYRRCCSAAASWVVRRLHVRLENQAPSATELCHCLEEECENQDAEFDSYSSADTESDADMYAEDFEGF